MALTRMQSCIGLSIFNLVLENPPPIGRSQPHVWDSEETGSAKHWKNLIRSCIHQKEVETWNLGIQEKAKKLRLYRTLKVDFGREVYLKLPYEQQSLIAELRCGSNRLRIDMGRRSGEKVEERICLSCGSGQVEDERHLTALRGIQ